MVLIFQRNSKVLPFAWTLFKLAEHCHTLILRILQLIIIIIIIIIKVCWGGGGGDFLLWPQLGVQLGEGHEQKLQKVIPWHSGIAQIYWLP